MRNLITIIGIMFSFGFAPIRLSAQVPAPTGTFASAFNIQNQSVNNGKCAYFLSNANGEGAYFGEPGNSISINAGSVMPTNIYLPALTGLPVGQFNGIIMCDQSMVTVVNHSANGGTISGGSYLGIDQTQLSTNWYAPNVMKDYYSFFTNFVVQNPNNTATTVTQYIYQIGSSNAVNIQAFNIPAYGHFNLQHSQTPGLFQNNLYSAKLIANNPIAVEVNVYGTSGANGQMYSYLPFTAGTTTSYAPIAMKNINGYYSSLNIQNIGSVATNIRVTFSNGASWVKTNIPPSGLAEFYMGAIPAGISVPDGQYAAKIQAESYNGNSAQPVVSVVNMSNSALGKAASYTSVNGASKVRGPIVHKNFYSFSSKIYCQNASNASTTITVAYSNAAANQSQFVSPNQLFAIDVAQNNSLPSSYEGSVNVTSNPAYPITCVFTEDATGAGDRLYAYEGIPN